MKVLLCGLDEELIAAWKKEFDGCAQVEVVNKSIFEVETDALVSPANSFGYMDGGLDLDISFKFGWKVQEQLQQLIKKKHHGELVVGTADIIATDNNKIPYVISAPTMRVPMILGADTVNSYLSTRAVLLLIKHGLMNDTGAPVSDVVKTVAFPGMGTGVGLVPFDVCARQMRFAVDHVIGGGSDYHSCWLDTYDIHEKMCGEEAFKNRTLRIIEALP